MLYLLSVLSGVILFLTVFYLLSRYIGIGRITYRRYFSESGVFEGESVRLIEEISNNFFLPLLFVDVESFLCKELALTGREQSDYPMQSFFSRFNLMPYTKIKRSIDLTCLKRGVYELETVAIHFFYLEVFLISKAVIYVYPSVLPYNGQSSLQNEMKSSFLAERKLISDPFSISGIRDYIPGDPFSIINFKATAKTGALKVNNNDYLTSKNFMIYLDFHGKADAVPLDTAVYERIMENALSWSADILQKAILQGYMVGFSANCKTVSGERFIRYPMGSGQYHYGELLKEMAGIRTFAGNSLLSVMHFDLNSLKNTEIIIFTLDTEQDFNNYINVFRGMGNFVSIVQL